jgi:intein/homing endonuclease
MEEIFKNDKFSYLIGALADGSLYSNKDHYVYRVTYYQHSKKYLLNCIEPRIKRLFDIKGHFYYDIRKSVYFYEITSKKVYQIYKLAVESFKDNIDRKIPLWIKHGEKSNQQRFISGFFDADGWYYIIPEKYDYRVRFGQSEYCILQDIKDMLDTDFKCSEVLGPYQSKENVKPYFELHIHGIDQVYKFHKIIKPCHPDKQISVKQLRKSHQ